MGSGLFILRVMALFFALLPAAYAAEPSRNLSIQQANRVALVVGNGAYGNTPLKNPPNDARDMARVLRKLGFDVIEKIDVGQKDFNRAIVEFGSRLNANSMALFYYAGHGMQVRGKNYLIPVDAQIATEAAVRAEAVDVDAVLDQFSVSRLNIVILDACRNNPFERKFRSMGGGLSQMDAPKGTLIAYATAPGKVASDGGGQNGLYTQELIKQIQAPGVQAETVFKRVRANVARLTGDNQIPWEASSLTGEFYFGGKDSADSGESGSVQQAVPQYSPVNLGSAAIELAYWDSIKDSKNIADFEAYLEKYPDGEFASLARNRIESASRMGPEGEVAPDISGKWKWSVRSIFVPDRVNTIKPDGTCKVSDGTLCTWKYISVKSRRVDFYFNNDWTHNMTVSADGKTMRGSDDWGTTVTGFRTGPLEEQREPSHMEKQQREAQPGGMFVQ